MDHNNSSHVLLTLDPKVINQKCLSPLFSSPEHKVLMVSFCDRPISVVHNFFKHRLLLNHWANLDETLQGCSFGEAQPSCSRD